MLLLLAGAAGDAFGAVRYVDVSNASPTPPYTNWATAARVIQDAVDAAEAGDEIVVTNGLYANGGRAVGTNLLDNRVAVDKPLTLRSINGPEFTVIQGYQVPGITNGDSAIRCVYLATGASLSGFTLTNGATRTAGGYYLDQCGGGVWCEGLSAVVSNCVLTGNSAYYEGGGAYSGTLNHCTLTGNSASSGAGASGDVFFGCTLNHCTLTGNSALSGGGVYGCLLNNCVLTGNSASRRGGGASAGELAPLTLTNCTLTGNSADVGGGVFGGTLYNCTLAGNAAAQGGGVCVGTLYNCTVTGNAAMFYGGGVCSGTVNNCIVYFNTATKGANYFTGTSAGGGEITTLLNYACTTPLPTNGIGNIDADPWFADAAAGNFRLRPESPCIDAGTNLSAVLTNDLDGRPRPVDGNSDGVAAFDIGAYEYRELLVWQDSPNPTPPYATWATAAHVIQDAVDAAVTGDEIVVTNGLYATGGRAVGTNLLVNRVAVDIPLTLRSVNGPEFTVIQGYQVPGTTNGNGASRCEYLAGGASLSGFTLTNGATRTNGDYATDRCGGGVSCEGLSAVVSNCVLTGNSAYYEGGGAYSGTLNDCTLTGNSVTSTEFGTDGGGASQSALNHCTLTGNSAGEHGGGAYGGTLNHCTLTGNSAGWAGGGACGGTLNHCTLISNWASYGGGAADGTLNNCTVSGNSAYAGGGVRRCLANNCVLIGNSASVGGGASSVSTIWSYCTLNNCTLTSNSADVGGGIYGGTLSNCIVYFNTATNGANYSADQSYYGYPVTLDYCCTTPMPTNGVGNMTNAPLFVDYAGGNLRLQSNSPCINGGNDAYVTTDTDLDSNPRIVRGTVDIGAYEYQGPGSVISYARLQQYGLPIDRSADFADSDTDGHNNWQEWRCLTDPTNALSALRLLSASPDGANVTVSWQSMAGVDYFLERCTNLSACPPFTPLASGIPGQAGTTTYTDTNATDLAPLFYRVGVVD